MPQRAKKPQSRSSATDPAEYQRFLDMAREVEADEDPEALDRAFDKVIPPPKKRTHPKESKA